MRSCVVLLFASLLTLCEAQGTIVTPVFVLKGRDLLLKLHADPPERVLYVDWKINKTVTLVRFAASGVAFVFTGSVDAPQRRFEFPEKRFFLILMNLQEADSGVYTAVAVTLQGYKALVEYQVTVQGPVSPVELTDVDRVDSNSSVTLVRIVQSTKSEVYGSVTGRLECEKFSVTLKNVQEVDSGVYSAEAATPTGDKLLTEYKVTVQGPVSPVELIVDRVDSSSSESCDLHVTCRTHNAHISSTFRCSKRVCSQEGGERSEVTTSGASLQVYLLKNVIICNHNNQVHRTHDLIHAEQLCYPSTDSPSHLGWVIAVCVLSAIFIVVLVIVVGVIVRLYKDRERGMASKRKDEDTLREGLKRLGVLNAISESLLKNRSPADPSDPSYSSVPPAAEPTDP